MPTIYLPPKKFGQSDKIKNIVTAWEKSYSENQLESKESGILGDKKARAGWSARAKEILEVATGETYNTKEYPVPELKVEVTLHANDIFNNYLTYLNDIYNDLELNARETEATETNNSFIIIRELLLRMAARLLKNSASADINDNGDILINVFKNFIKNVFPYTTYKPLLSNEKQSPLSRALIANGSHSEHLKNFERVVESTHTLNANVKATNQILEYLQDKNHTILLLLASELNLQIKENDLARNRLQTTIIELEANLVKQANESQKKKNPHLQSAILPYENKNTLDSLQSTEDKHLIMIHCLSALKNFNELRKTRISTLYELLIMNRYLSEVFSNIQGCFTALGWLPIYSGLFDIQAMTDALTKFDDNCISHLNIPDYLKDNVGFTRAYVSQQDRHTLASCKRDFQRLEDTKFLKNLKHKLQSYFIDLNALSDNSKKYLKINLSFINKNVMSNFGLPTNEISLLTNNSQLAIEEKKTENLANSNTQIANRLASQRSKPVIEDFYYNAFEIQKSEAYKILTHNLTEIKDFLSPSIRLCLMQEENFLAYVKQQGAIDNNINLDEIERKINEYVDDQIIIMFLNYYVRDQNVPKLEVQTNLLRAISHIQKIELFIYTSTDNTFELFVNYKPKDATHCISLLITPTQDVRRFIMNQEMNTINNINFVPKTQTKPIICNQVTQKDEDGKEDKSIPCDLNNNIESSSANEDSLISDDYTITVADEKIINSDDSDDNVEKDSNVLTKLSTGQKIGGLMAGGAVVGGFTGNIIASQAAATAQTLLTAVRTAQTLLGTQTAYQAIINAIAPQVGRNVASSIVGNLVAGAGVDAAAIVGAEGTWLGTLGLTSAVSSVPTITIICVSAGIAVALVGAGLGIYYFNDWYQNTYNRTLTKKHEEEIKQLHIDKQKLLTESQKQRGIIKTQGDKIQEHEVELNNLKEVKTKTDKLSEEFEKLKSYVLNNGAVINNNINPIVQDTIINPASNNNTAPLIEPNEPVRLSTNNLFTQNLHTTRLVSPPPSVNNNISINNPLTPNNNRLNVHEIKSAKKEETKPLSNNRKSNN